MSDTAMITKSNPRQAIDLSIAPIKFGQKSSNSFALNERKPKSYSKVAKLLVLG